MAPNALDCGALLQLTAYASRLSDHAFALYADAVLASWEDDVDTALHSGAEGSRLAGEHGLLYVGVGGDQAAQVGAVAVRGASTPGVVGERVVGGAFAIWGQTQLVARQRLACERLLASWRSGVGSGRGRGWGVTPVAESGLVVVRPWGVSSLGKVDRVRSRRQCRGPRGFPGEERAQFTDRAHQRRGDDYRPRRV
ncbi:hypothetical protein [Streptomyces sp. HUAS TT7]|uniref:hypothetical protein n=1 Tax=Streptomyces sp. HUAS TT7 TaxID=3447507 RepID=UPI003F65E9C5